MDFFSAKRFSALRCSLVIGSGLVFGLLLPHPWWISVAAALLSTIISFLFEEKFFYVSLLALSAAYGTVSLPPSFPSEIYGVPVLIEGKVSEEKQGSYSVLTIESPEMLKGRGVLLYLAKRWNTGTRICVKGEILPLSFPRNPGLPDRNKRLEREGIIGRIKENELRIVSPPRGFDAWLAWARKGILKRCEKIFGSEAALYSAILLGKTDLVSEDLFYDMRRTGTLHLLAVSGLNVGVLVAFLAFLFKLAGIGRKWSIPLLVLLLAAYVALVGPAPSIIRSSLMCLAVAIGFMIDRKTLPLNNLAIAAMAILLWKPVQILDIGFQLSFSATFAIILAADWIGKTGEEIKKIKIPPWLKKWFLAPIALSLSATIFTMPFIAGNFHQVTFSSALANLPAVPLVSLIFPAGLVALLLSAVWFPMGEILGYVISGGLWLLEKILNFFPGKLTQTASWPTTLVIALFAAALLFYTEKGNRLRFKLPLGILLLGANIGFWPWALENQKPSLTILDTYEGNVAVLRSDSRIILLNAGSRSENTVRNYLNSQNISKIDYLLCMSDKAGDLSGIDSLLRYYRVEKIGSVVKIKNQKIDKLPHTGILKLPSAKIEYDLAVRSRPFYRIESQKRSIGFISEDRNIDSTSVNYLLNNKLRPKVKGYHLLSKNRIPGVQSEAVRQTGGIVIDL